MKLIAHKLCLTALAALLLLTLSGPAQAAPIVETKTGLIQGVDLGGVNRFLGIPFAEAPVGELRWRPPQEKAPWNGVFVADSFCPACPQLPELSGWAGFENQSEDCLALNVWAPAGDVADLPVLVWLYGGAFQFGAASQPEYDGTALAARGAVVVSLNYRVGVLGFMVHPDMVVEQEHSGNFGLLDQLAALKWVKENIAAFGGSPDKVTIFGHSAGGASVWMHLFSPLGAGLFDRAVCQSGSGPGTFYATHGMTGSWEQAAALGAYLGELVGAADLAELRTVPAEQLMQTANDNLLYFSPVVDGRYLPADFRDLAGAANQVPVMVGSTKNDGLGWDEPSRTVEEYQEYLAGAFFDQAPLVEAAYPAENGSQAAARFDFVSTTAGFTEPARFTARATQAQGLPTYRYVFEYAPNTPRSLQWGAQHDVELPYLFGYLTRADGYGDYDFALSDKLVNYWIAFADSGDPNVVGQADWPTYGAEENILFIRDNLTVGQGYYDKDCDLFENIAPRTRPDYPGAGE